MRGQLAVLREAGAEVRLQKVLYRLASLSPLLVAHGERRHDEDWLLDTVQVSTRAARFIYVKEVHPAVSGAR